MSNFHPKLLFIADARSENFRRWIRYFVNKGDDVHVLSTYCCDMISGCKLYVLPSLLRASSALVKRSDATHRPSQAGILTSLLLNRGWDKHLFAVWSNIKLVNLPFQLWIAQRVIGRTNPDVTIAFRTQNEGYLAAMTDHHSLILFSQGQDFVAVARQQVIQSKMTSFVVRRVDALITDCDRDIRLARNYGLRSGVPVAVFPGNGGVDISVYAPGKPAEQRQRLIVFPRGLAPFIRFDTLLSGIRDLHCTPAYADVQFVLLVTPPVMGIARQMVLDNGLNPHVVQVRPFLPQPELAALLQSAAAIISPSQSDGTPNSMLEAMACGAFPIMGDLESIREWVDHGKNGLLFDPLNTNQLADCMRHALDDVALRQQAQVCNYSLIQERAAYHTMMPLARDFILRVANENGRADVSP
jgi:glycosyltransferase involved in cell wall biosynthesis